LADIVVGDGEAAFPLGDRLVCVDKGLAKRDAVLEGVQRFIEFALVFQQITQPGVADGQIVLGVRASRREQDEALTR